AALDYVEHFAGQAAVAALHRAREHHVAVEGALDELRRNEEVVVAPTLAQKGRHEPISFGFDVDHAGDFGAGLARGRRTVAAPDLLAPCARALDHRCRRTARRGGPVLLFRSGTRGDLAVDVAVEPGAAFLEKLGETAAHGLVVTVAEMELAGELFERKALPPRAM